MHLKKYNKYYTFLLHLYNEIGISWEFSLIDNKTIIFVYSNYLKIIDINMKKNLLNRFIFRFNKIYHISKKNLIIIAKRLNLTDYFNFCI